MKDLNKKIKEIINSGITKELVSICVGISIFVMGIHSKGTNVCQILILTIVTIAVILLILGALLLLNKIQVKNIQLKAKLLSYIYVLIPITTGITLTYIAFNLIVKESLLNCLSFFFIFIGLIGIFIETVNIFLKLNSTKKESHPKLQIITKSFKSIFYSTITIVLCTFFTWTIFSTSQDLCTFNHSMKVPSKPDCTKDTKTINQTKYIIDNNKNEDSIKVIQTNNLEKNTIKDSIVSYIVKSSTPFTTNKKEDSIHKGKAITVIQKNNLEDNVIDDSIVSNVVKGSAPLTTNKHKNIVDWLTIFNSSLQNLLGLIMFILGAVSLYYVNKQLKDSKKSREGDAFMQTFTTLLAQQHSILMKDSLTEKAFINNKCNGNKRPYTNAFSGFVYYFDEHIQGTDLSELWNRYKKTLRDPESFDCCFKYFYHMIEIILANKSILFDSQKEKFYLKLIQAELNHDILFCYLVNLLVHFQENPDAIDDLRRYRLYSTESFGDRILCEIDKTLNNDKNNVDIKLTILDKDIFKYLKYNSEHIDQYFTKRIIDEYEKNNESNGKNVIDIDKMKDTLEKNKTKQLKYIFTKRIINKIKKEFFSKDNTNKDQIKEEEFTILAQYHFFNDLKLNTEFIKRIWKIANIGFDRIETNESKHSYVKRYLEVKNEGSNLELLYEREENRLVLFRKGNENKEFYYYIVNSYFPRCLLSFSRNFKLNISYNNVTPVNQVRIPIKGKTITLTYSTTKNETIKDDTIKIANGKIHKDDIEIDNKQLEKYNIDILDNFLYLKNTIPNIYSQNLVTNDYMRNLRLLTGFYIIKENEENKGYTLYSIDGYDEAVQYY